MIYPANSDVVSAYMADTDHVSQSGLKRMLSGMDAYNHEKDELYFEEKTHFTIGSGVDSLLCFGKTYFEEYHYISHISKPSGKTASIIKYVFDNAELAPDDPVVTLSNHEQLILDGCVKEGFQPSWGDSAKVSNIVRGGDPYFNDLVRAIGKQILAPEEKELIDSIVASFKENPTTRIYFNRKYCPEGVDIYYQVPIYIEYLGVKVKVLIDMIAVDHVNKVVRPIDIKTTGDYTTNFAKSARRFRYDIQAAFYQDVLANAIRHNYALPFVSAGYTVASFAFLVESTVVQGNALRYVCDPEFMSMGRRGRDKGYIELISYSGRDKINYDAIPGYSQLIAQYTWHLDNGFTKDKDVVDGGNVFNLGWKGKYL